MPTELLLACVGRSSPGSGAALTPHLLKHRLRQDCSVLHFRVVGGDVLPLATCANNDGKLYGD